jgi:hypothetical protein
MAFARGPQIVRDGLKVYLDVSNNKCVDYTQPITSGTTLTNLVDKSIRFVPYDASAGNMMFDNEGNQYVYKQNGLNGGEPGWMSENPITTVPNYTFIIWFKFLTGVSNQRGENIYGGGFSGVTSMYLSSGGTSNAHGYLRYSNGGSIGSYSHTTPYGINDGNWHCMATVDSGVDSNKTTKFYVDGELKHTYSSIPVDHVSMVGDKTMTWGSWALTYGNFTGSSAMYMYYEKALLDEQILQNFNATKSRFGL